MRWLALVPLALPAIAWAQEPGPRFCPNQPSLESSACTTEPGRVHLEVSAVDWTLERDGDERRDSFLFGDFQARFGVGPATEVQLSWTPIGHVRERPGARSTGIGDVRLAVRQNLRNPDGSGLSYGLEPFVTLPVGGQTVGQGTWGAGLVLPVTYEVRDGLTLGITTELDASPDEDRHRDQHWDRQGRHFGANIVTGASLDLSSELSVTAEAEWMTDDDPAGHEQRWLAATGVQYRYARTRALFVEAVAGLNREAPDVQLYCGISALF